MDLHDLGRAIGFLLIPLFWVIVLAVPLWLIRKFAPKAEFWLYSPLWTVIRRLAGRDQPESQAARQPGQVGRTQ